MNLDFDASTHTYRLDGRKVPNVTGILTNVFGDRPYWSEWHAQKGRAVHHAIHLYLKDRLDWNSVDERIAGRVKAFERFLAETGLRPTATELRLASKRYQFAGTLDILADRTLFDIKPPKPEPFVEIQLGFYSLLCEENKVAKIKNAAALCLRDNGTYTLKLVENLRQAQQVALACLTVSNWKERAQCKK